MTLTGGKRKVNKSLKAWVAFVKKVQKEEKLSYKDAIHRAKVRKDKGEKWMRGGGDEMETGDDTPSTPSPIEMEDEDIDIDMGNEDIDIDEAEMTGGKHNIASLSGGRRRRRTRHRKKHGGSRRRRHSTRRRRR